MLSGEKTWRELEKVIIIKETIIGLVLENAAQNKGKFLATGGE